MTTTGPHTLTVVLDCLDVDQLLHTHDHRCYVRTTTCPADGACSPVRCLADTAQAFPTLLDGVGPGTYELAWTWDSRISARPVIPRQRPTAPRCPVMDLPVDSCAHCRGEVSPQEELDTDRARRRAARTAPRPATSPGTCARCRRPYGPGTLIRPDRLTRGWVPSCCGELL